MSTAPIPLDVLSSTDLLPPLLFDFKFIKCKLEMGNNWKNFNYSNRFERIMYSNVFGPTHIGKDKSNRIKNC